jgi:hypothetical protein
VAQWGGLFLGAWLAWTYAAQPKLVRETPASLIGEALFDVLFVWVCCAPISFLILLATSLADFSEIIGAALLAACDAVWFAPAILLLSGSSPGAILLSLILVVNTTRVLVARSMRRDYLKLSDIDSPRRTPFIFPELAAPFFSWKCVPALLGAFCAQAGVVSLFNGYTLLSAVFFAVCAAILTAFSIGAEAYRPKDQQDAPRSGWNILATLILAAALSSGGLQLAFSLSPPGAIAGGPLANTRAALHRALHRTPEPVATPEPRPNVTQVYAPLPGVTPIGGAYSGVILQQKVKNPPAAILPIHLRNGLFRDTATHARTIPFSGVYWLFRPPAPRPPPDATVREGTPLESAFSTTNGTPIRMEAHQPLNPPVNIRCCDRIKVDFANAEGTPGVLYAGMILFDTTAGGATTESLAVLDTPLSAKNGTFEFPIPRPSALRQFNEIEVFFYLDWLGSDRTPKVGVEQFVLVPR